MFRNICKKLIRFDRWLNKLQFYLKFKYVHIAAFKCLKICTKNLSNIYRSEFLHLPIQK